MAAIPNNLNYFPRCSSYRARRCARGLLVHDRSVYLMSNGQPPDLVNAPRRFVAYAKGCHPDRDPKWRAVARELVGDVILAVSCLWRMNCGP
ncbi:DUF3085 domain-containing protein [Bradyrhizobium elkanii]